MVVAFTTWKFSEAALLKATPEALIKLLPVITTIVPTGPEAGLKLVIARFGTVTRKLVLLLAVPPDAATTILPVVAPTGTVALMEVAFNTIKEAEAPLKVTPVAQLKPLPEMV